MRLLYPLGTLAAVLVTAVLLAVCAHGPGDRALEEMTPEEHLREAEREHRLADEEFEKARGQIEPPQRLPGEDGLIWWTPWDSSFEPGEPEYYTVDPRVRDPDEEHVDRAREHRRKAEWHEAQAERKRRSY